MGTEEGLSWLPDLLPEFCQLNKIPLPVGWERTKALFPRALQAPDWCHIMDIILKHGLASLRWFPRFLERLKALVKFFREHGKDIAHDLKKQGLPAVGNMLENLKLTIFIKRRWGTLFNVTNEINDVYETMH